LQYEEKIKEYEDLNDRMREIIYDSYK
jgi:hypothetical protein